MYELLFHDLIESIKSRCMTPSPDTSVDPIDVEYRYRLDLIAELIDYVEHPTKATKEWKESVIQVARDRGYGHPPYEEDPTVLREEFITTLRLVASGTITPEQAVSELFSLYNAGAYPVVEQHEVVKWLTDTKVKHLTTVFQVHDAGDYQYITIAQLIADYANHIIRR